MKTTVGGLGLLAYPKEGGRRFPPCRASDVAAISRPPT